MQRTPFIDMVSYQKKECKWALRKPEDKAPEIKDPHIHEEYYKPKKICDGIFEAIGNTPLVRLQNLPKSEGIKCEVLVKCEYLNPGGSAKDRISRRMVLDAEKIGRIKPYENNTIIEATSGNTGWGLSLIAAVKKYNMIITLPEKMSQEKSDTWNALGAKIVRTPTEANFWDDDSHASVARKIKDSTPNSVILDQYVNPSNPMAHYDQTAEEIWDQCDGKWDCCVISAGTGGTWTGIARKWKEKIRISESSPLILTGIGYDFIPKTCDRSSQIVDEWIKTEDFTSFRMARKWIKEEGLLVGGSSGSTMVAAWHVAKQWKEGQRVVVICVDGVRNYMSKFLNDDWMYENGFYSQEEYDRKYYDQETLAGMDTKGTINELNLPTVKAVDYTKWTVKTSLKLFKDLNTDALIVVNANGDLVGLLQQRNWTTLITSGRISLDDVVGKAVCKDIRKVFLNDPLYYLSRGFGRHECIIVVDKNDKTSFRLCRHQDYLAAYLKNNNIEI